ncbi:MULTISPECIES: hypothetical protein [unclassified Streptomyces]|uniref:hypothetical protein n=1 Tax=unclassified Streptomyces TaxID=2593676 RepID=UPI003369D2AB
MPRRPPPATPPRAAPDAHSVTPHACWSPDSPNPALHRLAAALTREPRLGVS